MKRTKKECPKCNRKVSLSNYKRHYHSCRGPKKETIKIKEEWKQKNEFYKCPYCDKEYSKNGIGTHIWATHGEGKNKKRKKGIIPWNKGLTKKTDKRIQKYGETYKTRIKSGLIQGSFEGKHHTNKSKEKISKSLIKYLELNPDKVPHRLNHSSKKSYPEELFENELKKREIKGWIYNYQNGIYAYDFAWPELKIDVEIDGGTHEQEKVKKIDKRRDNFSKEQGWKIIRFKAKDVKQNINNCIKIINKELNK